MAKAMKLKLLAYLLISAVGFSYLILPQNAGISVSVFIFIQFVLLYYLEPQKKPLLVFIPILILALHSFISANGIWLVSNFLVALILYSVMALWMADNLPVKELSLQFINNILANIVQPFAHFRLPFTWCLEANQEHAKTAKRILIGVAISIPCLLFLLIMLSYADQIFSHGATGFFNWTLTLINFNMLFKIPCGFIAGFYLFGLIYAVYQPKSGKTTTIQKKNGDPLILNILLISILIIYTIFVIIQFKYLFASGNNLPYGLTYTGYARRGFFELLFLTGLNISLILLTIHLTKEQTGKWIKLTQTLCCYLCAVTAVMLSSSFYRMWLYSNDYGLTRLRFLVFGFLIFEAIGLIFTFFYIIRPKFNIIAVYLGIGLIYYLLLNVAPMDAVIAQNQIDKYFATGKSRLEYTFTLSADAAPQIARLLESNDPALRNKARHYLATNYNQYNSIPLRWQRWNLSVSKLDQYSQFIIDQ